jgi:hypothetical protein
MVTLKVSIDQINQMQLLMAKKINPHINVPVETQLSLVKSFNNLKETLTKIGGTVEVFNKSMIQSAITSMTMGSDSVLNIELFKEIIARIPTAAEYELDIPDHVLDKVENTIELMEPLLQQEDGRILTKEVINNYNITINNHQSDSSNLNTWLALFTIFFTIITFVYQVQQDKENRIDKEQDRIIQQQQFEDFIKVSNDLIDAVHPVLNELPISEQIQDQNTPK